MTSPDRLQDARGSDARDGEEAKAREQARIMALKIVVIVLGVILVAMALVVFSTLIIRAVKGRGGESPPIAAPATPPAPPAGPSRVVSTALGDGRFALTLDQGGVLTVVIYDAATMRELSRTTLPAQTAGAQPR